MVDLEMSIIWKNLFSDLINISETTGQIDIKSESFVKENDILYEIHMELRKDIETFGIVFSRMSFVKLQILVTPGIPPLMNIQ